jgi:catechol 2,3-dioxygenase-like lactoylglutathione lyase family enzyme
MEISLKDQINGIQHIGIPTNDIEATIEFYEKLGFKIALRTMNEEANEKVAFLKLENLVIETYENKEAKMEAGAIDHVAIDVKDIEKVYELITQEGLNTTKDMIHFLPFWENGVRFFTIEGPNKEKVEFSQYLYNEEDR